MVNVKNINRNIPTNVKVSPRRLSVKAKPTVLLQVTDRVLDLIMLMARRYIFRCRCLKVTPNFVFQEKSSKEQS